MIYEDNEDKILMEDELEELSPWEVEERGIHIFSYKNMHRGGDQVG